MEKQKDAPVRTDAPISRIKPVAHRKGLIDRAAAKVDEDDRHTSGNGGGSVVAAIGEESEQSDKSCYHWAATSVDPDATGKHPEDEIDAVVRLIESGQQVGEVPVGTWGEMAEQDPKPVRGRPKFRPSAEEGGHASHERAHQCFWTIPLSVGCREGNTSRYA